jgi:phosphopantothenoylcysteine decarboxylase/phosphopantothenate--cysteine ligase
VNDIIASLSAEKDQQVVIGFAAEHGCDTERARAKMERKGIDAIVYNDVSDQTIGFDSNDNAVTLITAETEVAIERRPKPQIASAIVDLAVDLLSR